MYTDAMRAAVRSLDHHAPKGFGVVIMDNDNFLVVRAPEQQFMRLSDRGKKKALEYMVRVKAALEDNGAIVLLVREGGKP